jgi:hypothetical protein
MNGKDKYKFTICFDGKNYHPVKLTKPVTISGQLDSKSFRYACKSSVWKFVKSENPFIYNSLLPWIKRPTDLIYEILVKIELWEDWNTLSQIEFEGYIPLSGVSINEDTGVIEVTPTERSAYDWYDHHKGDKVDVYNSVNSYEQLDYFVQTVTEEYWILNGELILTPSGFVGEPESVAFYNQSKSYEPIYKENSWAKYGLDLYHCLTANGPGNVHLPGESIYWELIPHEHGVPINTVNHVYRQVSDLPFFHQIGVNSYLQFYQGNNVYDRFFPAVTELITGATNLPSIRWGGSVKDPLDGNMSLCGHGFTENAIHDGYIISEGRNQKLTDIISHLLQINYEEVVFSGGSGLTIVSQFLSAATNPVTGQANHLANLRMVHNRVIKNIQDLSTKGEMTLDGMITDLCEAFNLSWCIIGANFYIEHINYFINGFSYNSTPGIYADLTGYALKDQVVNDLDGQIADQEYKYPVSTPEIERFHFPGGFDYDGQIKYDSLFAIKGDVLTHDISLFSTDFTSILSLNSDNTDDGWCLIAAAAAVNDIAVIWRRTAGLRWLQGPQIFLGVSYDNPFLPYNNRKNTGLTFSNPAVNYPNGDLMWNNLLNDFWIYQRFFQQGQINGKIPSITFTTQKRIRKQREVRFPRLSGVFDPYKLITTNLGNGGVETFNMSTDSDFIKAQLLYDEKP